jgi:hypothetical protein
MSLAGGGVVAKLRVALKKAVLLHYNNLHRSFDLTKTPLIVPWRNSINGVLFFVLCFMETG